MRHLVVSRRQALRVTRRQLAQLVLLHLSLTIPTVKIVSHLSACSPHKEMPTEQAQIGRTSSA
jgi:hypothetical protein